MPNWCECDLDVEGRRKDVTGFLEFLGEGFDFNRFVPYPERFAALDEEARRWDERRRADPENCGPRPRDGFNQGGYEWCIENWGTKWNACDVIMPEQPADGDGSDFLEVVINFQTAWSPPLPVILAASEKFPELAFALKYFECGVGFNGRFFCEAGRVVSDESGDYFGDRGG